MTTVTLSDECVALSTLHTEAAQLDLLINAKTLELLQIQKEMSQLIDQRDALLITANLIQKTSHIQLTY